MPPNICPPASPCLRPGKDSNNPNTHRLTQRRCFLPLTGNGLFAGTMKARCFILPKLPGHIKRNFSLSVSSATKSLQVDIVRTASPHSHVSFLPSFTISRPEKLAAQTVVERILIQYRCIPIFLSQKTANQHRVLRCHTCMLRTCTETPPMRHYCYYVWL